MDEKDRMIFEADEELTNAYQRINDLETLLTNTAQKLETAIHELSYMRMEIDQIHTLHRVIPAMQKALDELNARTSDGRGGGLTAMKLSPLMQKVILHMARHSNSSFNAFNSTVGTAATFVALYRKGLIEMVDPEAWKQKQFVTYRLNERGMEVAAQLKTNEVSHR